MWAPNGFEYESVKGGTWCGKDCGQPGDGETLEHIPELIQKAGYAKAYPSDFGMEPGTGTTLALAMDAARGGYFAQNPWDISGVCLVCLRPGDELRSVSD